MSEPLPQQAAERFIPIDEVIRHATALNIPFGRPGGDPYHTLRYYTKIGLLPHMIRKLPYPGAKSTVGHYPESVIETLKQIAALKKQGLDNEAIKQELEPSPPPATPELAMAGAAPPPSVIPSSFLTLPEAIRNISQTFTDLTVFIRNMVRKPYPYQEPTRHRIFTHLLTLLLIFITLTILSLGFSDLTRARVKRWLVDGFWNHFAGQIVSVVSPKIGREMKGEILSREILNPIVDINDAFEYVESARINAEQNAESPSFAEASEGRRGETWLRPKLPLDVGDLVTQTFQVVKSGVLNTARFLGTIFFGKGDQYYITPAADGSLHSLRIEEALEADLVSTDYLIISSSMAVANLNADFLDSLDSSQFLRSDVSDEYTSGTLTFAAGTTLNVNSRILNTTGDLTIADSLSQTGGGQVTFSGNVDANSGLDVAGITVLGDGGISNFAQFSSTGDLAFYGSADIITAEGTLLINPTGDLYLQSTSGEIDLTSAGLMDLNAGANLDVDVIGTFDLLSTGAFSIDGTGASNLSAASGDLTLSTITSGNLLLTAADDTVVSTGAFDLDNTGAITIGTDANEQNITFETANFDVNSTGTITIDGTDFTYTPTGTYTVNATGAVGIDSDASATFSGAGINLTSDGANAVTITYDATGGTFELTDGTTRIEFADDGSAIFGDDGATTWIDGSLITLSGNTVIVGTITETIPDNTTNAFDLEDENNDNYININTTNGSEEIQFGNAVTNSIYSFLGTGSFAVSTTGDFVATLATNIDLATANLFAADIDIGTSAQANTITIGTPTALATLELDSADWGITTSGVIDGISGYTQTDGAFSHTGTTSTLNLTGAIDIDSATLDILTTAGFSIDGTGASNVSTTSGSLTLSTIASGDLLLISAGDVDLTATNFDINSGVIDLSTQATDIEIIDDTSPALTISQGTDNYLGITTTNGSEAIVLGNTSTNPTLTVSGSGQITLSGNVDANSGLDVTGASLTVGGTNFEVTTGGAVSTVSTVNSTYLPTSTTDKTIYTQPAAVNPTQRWLFDGVATYTDTDVMMGDTNDLKYYAYSTPFSGIYLAFSPLGIGYNISAEYSKGASVWGSLTITDETSNFTSNGSIYFTPPGDWATDTVNGVSGYWIRFSTGTVPTQTATTTANYILPAGYAFATYLSSEDANPKFYVDYRGNVQVATLLVAQDLEVQGNVRSNLIPSQNNQYDLGSSGLYWDNAYINEVTANNLVGTVVTGATSSNTWTINSDAGDPPTEDMSLIFYRGGVEDNAVLGWNETNDDLTLNSSLILSSTIETARLEVPGNIDSTGGAIQTSSTTRIDNAGNLSNIGTYTSSVAPAGTTSVDLISGTLTNDTASGTQRGLVLTLAGTGDTENGAYITYTGTGTGTTALEIDGTWTNGIVTNDHLINIGSGNFVGTTGNIDLTNFDVVGSTGNITTAGNLAVNGGEITSTVATLIINAAGAVDIQDNLTADQLTTDVGGVSIAAAQSYTGAGAVTLSSGGANTLTIDTGGAAALNIGTTTQNALTLGNAGVNTTINGANIILGAQADAADEAVRADRNLTAGVGLTGGGTLIADRTFDVGAGDGIDVAADSIAVDVTDILGTGLSETSNNINVVYGSIAGTSAQGNVTHTGPGAGTGLTGGGGTIAVGTTGTFTTINAAGGTDISVAADAINNTSTLATVTGRGPSTTTQLAFNYNAGSPFTVLNSTVVTNLNADLLDGYSWGNVPDGTDIWVNETGDTMSGDLNFNNYGIGVVGLYSATRYQNVFSMGAAYTPADDGTSLSNMYGIAWTHSNIGGQSKAGLSHQALFVEAGVTKTAIGTGIWTAGNLTVDGGVIYLNATGVPLSSGIIFNDDDALAFNEVNNNYRFTSDNVTRLTLDGSNLIVAGDLTVSGSDIVLTADGSPLTSSINFNNNDIILYDDSNNDWKFSADGSTRLTIDDSNLIVAGNLTVPGRIYAGVIYRTCAYPAGQGYADCSCAAGETLLSGGSYAGATGSLRENRPMSTTTWRVACVDPNGNRIDCANVDILCSRLEAGGSDVAEYFPTNEDPQSLKPGTLVSMDPANTAYIKKSDRPYDKYLLGIVPTNPGTVIGEETKGDRQMVALVGRVPTLVSLEGGRINLGDLLTSSSIPGYGMKINSYRGGAAVGIALEEFNPSTDSSKVIPCPAGFEDQTCGKIMVFVNRTTHDPQIYLTDTGDLTIVSTQMEQIAEGESTQIEQMENGLNRYELADAEGNLITRIGAFAELVVAKIRTGLIEAESLITNYSITNYLTAREKIISPVIETDLLVAKEAEIETLTAGTIKADKIEGVEFNQVTNVTEVTEVTVISEQQTANGEQQAPVPEQSTVQGGARFIEVISDKLQVIKGIFEELIVQNLTALTARITNLFARNITVEEKLISPVADFGEVTSDKLQTARLEIRSEGETTGEAIIPSGETEILITNNLITNNSRIFVTPQVAVPIPLAVTEIKEGESFTITIAEPQEFDVPFHWWMVTAVPAAQ